MKTLKKIIYAMGLGLALTACGGSGSDSSGDIDLKISVPTTSTSQKTSKITESFDVDEVTVVNLDNNEELTAEKDGDVYVVTVPGNADIHIRVRIRNANGNLMTFEKYVDDVDKSDHDINEDTTKIAALLVKESSDTDKPIKDLLRGENDVIRDIVKDLEDISSRDFINHITEASANTDSIDNASEEIAKALQRLEALQEVLAKLEERINSFENGENINHDVLNEQDVESDGKFGDDIDGDFLAENLVRPHDADDFAERGEMIIPENGPRGPILIIIEIDADGNLIIVRGEESRDLGLRIPKNHLKGKFLEVNDNKLIVQIRSNEGDGKVELIIPNDNTSLVEALGYLSEGSHIGVSYKEEDEVKIVKKVFAEGKTHGVLKELTDSSITLTLEDGSEVTFKKHIREVVIPIDPQPTLPEIIEDAISPNSELTQNGKKRSEDGVSIDRPDIDEAIAISHFRPEFNFAVGDEIAVHWIIEGNQILVMGVFPTRKEDPSDGRVFIEGKIESINDQGSFVIKDYTFNVTDDTKVNFDEKLSVGMAVFVVGVNTINGSYNAIEIGSLKLDDPIIIDTDGVTASNEPTAIAAGEDEVK
ncbi:MAG: hypothetical protein COA79_14185 [Planctomycetota bacterium]|nr:MAG: hypothetical protein COA79_14185 [Planctomycetota bacterium]